MKDANAHFSSVVLGDTESTWEDPLAKSVSYFCRKGSVRVDEEVISKLKTIAKQRGDENARFCLHQSPNDLFHEMVVLLHKRKYYRPHKHPAKDESSHVIEGSMGVFVFDDNGDIGDACLLENRGNFLYRVGANAYHTVLPLTDQVIFLESKLGPFQSEQDKIYPVWAPDGSSPVDTASYAEMLLKVLGERIQTLSLNP